MQKASLPISSSCPSALLSVSPSIPCPPHTHTRDSTARARWQRSSVMRVCTCSLISSSQSAHDLGTDRYTDEETEPHKPEPRPGCRHLPFLQPVRSLSPAFVSLSPSFWGVWQVGTSLRACFPVLKQGRQSSFERWETEPVPLPSPHPQPLLPPSTRSSPFPSLPPLSSRLSLCPASSPVPRPPLSPKTSARWSLAFLLAH